MTEADAKRARADKCRRSARQYSSETGSSLEELAAALDREADILDEKNRNPG